jgi:hypothetical protein
MEIILITYTVLMVGFFDALLSKFDVYGRFEKYASNDAPKLIYKLSKCRFCILFHLGWVSSVVVIPFVIYDITIILTPFVVSGALKLIKND